MRKKDATSWGHEWEYSKEYVQELEAKLWEMISLNKGKNDFMRSEEAINNCISTCLKEAEEFLNK